MMVPFAAVDSMFVYFSEIDGRHVADADGKIVGVFSDILIEPIGKYARAKTLVIRRGLFRPVWARVAWSDVAVFSRRGVSLKVPGAGLHFTASQDLKSDLSLRQDILDQQVVDTDNQNVIRVNDIHLLFAEQDLVVAHVDIGLRGIVRRLGYEPAVDALVRLLQPGSPYLNRPRLISWKHIQPLSINPVSMTVKVDVSQQQLLKIPAEDLGEMMLDLAPQHRLALFKTLDIAAKSRVFMALEFKEQKSLLEDLTDKEALDVLNAMPDDEAVDFLGALPQAAVNRYLGLMESKDAKMLSKMLGYASTSAGGLMTTEFIAVPSSVTIAEALAVVKEKTLMAETIQIVYIVDPLNHLVGVTTLRRLIVADGTQNILKAALPKTIFLKAEDDVKRIAFLMDKYHFHVLPVVDAAGVLVGIITIDDIFSRLVTLAFRRAIRRKEVAS